MRLRPAASRTISPNFTVFALAFDPSSGSPWLGELLLGILIRGMKSFITACTPLMAAMVMEIGSVPFGSCHMRTRDSGAISVDSQLLWWTSAPSTSMLTWWAVSGE